MRKIIRSYSTSFLFPKNSFRIGMGSIFNISGNYYSFTYSESAQEADARAIENDWGVIGQDIKKAVKKTRANTLK